MKDIRELDLWTKDIFYQGRDWTSDRAFKSVIWFIALMVFGGVFGLGVLADAMNNFMILWGLIPLAVVAIGGPFLGKIHPLYALYAFNENSYPGDDYYAAKNYLSLPKAERELAYPANILEMLKNPDLSSVQRTVLINQMGRTYTEVTKCMAARKKANQRHIDVAPVVEEMERRRKWVSIETETFNQFYQE
jgi:hypothetical protein